MSDRKKLSGAAFKRIRVEKQAESVRNTHTIGELFTKQNGLLRNWQFLLYQLSYQCLAEILIFNTTILFIEKKDVESSQMEIDSTNEEKSDIPSSSSSTSQKPDGDSEIDSNNEEKSTGSMPSVSIEQLGTISRDYHDISIVVSIEIFFIFIIFLYFWLFSWIRRWNRFEGCSRFSINFIWRTAIQNYTKGPSSNWHSI